MQSGFWFMVTAYISLWMWIGENLVNWSWKRLIYLMLEKTRLVSYDHSNNSGVVDVKKDGSNLYQKSTFNVFWLGFLHCLYPLKLLIRKSWAFICSRKCISSEVLLHLYRSTLYSYTEYYCHIKAGPLNCYFDMLNKLCKWLCKVAGLVFATFLQW